LADDEDWQLIEDFSTEGLFDEAAFSRCYAKYSHLHGTKLLQDVYRRYPYYAIKSERAAKIMNDQEMSAIAAARPATAAACFFTIGYEGSSLEGYESPHYEQRQDACGRATQSPKPQVFLRKTGIEAERKGAPGPVQHLPQRQARCDYLFRVKCLYVSPGVGCESNVRVPRLEVQHSSHLKFLEWRKRKS
jgi:hypothetical protein